MDKQKKQGPSKTEINLQTAFIGEAEANRKYTAYAMKAMEEGKPEIAQIFLEIAGGETIHAINHLIKAGGVKDTAENLRSVIEGEQYEFEVMYPKMIEQALAEGREDAAASFRLAWEREAHHRNQFRQALAMLEGKPLPEQEARPTTIATGPAVQPSAKAVMEIDTGKERISGLARIREVVFGAQDGIISTVGLVAGVFGATAENQIVLIAGLALAIAGSLSMAAGAYLSSKAERELYVAEIAREKEELEKHPAEELAELRYVYQREGWSEKEIDDLLAKIVEDKDLWLETLAAKELGISPAHLLIHPIQDAVVMGVSYLLGAAVPVLPFLFLRGLEALTLSIILAALALFLVGVIKATITHRKWLQSGLEITLVGLIVAVIGYVFGSILPASLG